MRKITKYSELLLGPVDCAWASWWTDWTTCSNWAGEGTQERLRAKTPALHGGKECEGNSREIRLCKIQEFPCKIQ